MINPDSEAEVKKLAADIANRSVALSPNLTAYQRDIIFEATTQTLTQWFQENEIVAAEPALLSNE